MEQHQSGIHSDTLPISQPDRTMWWTPSSSARDLRLAGKMEARQYNQVPLPETSFARQKSWRATRSFFQRSLPNAKHRRIATYGRHRSSFSTIDRGTWTNAPYEILLRSFARPTSTTLGSDRLLNRKLDSLRAIFPDVEARSEAALTGISDFHQLTRDHQVKMMLCIAFSLIRLSETVTIPNLSRSPHQCKRTNDDHDSVLPHW